MARAVSTRRKLTMTILVWLVALIVFFPILYTIVTSLKTEGEAAAGFSMIPSWTLESYALVLDQQDYFRPFTNSVIISIGSTLLALAISIPAAWAMAFSPTPRTRDVLMWMLSTKMMPAAGVLVPMYLIFLNTGLLDTLLGLTIILTLVNLPIVVWMVYTYFKDIPVDILEAARLDGATTWQEIVRVLLPIARGGLASTMLLSLILCWNEAFWSLNLTSSAAAPLTALVASYSSPEGLFWAKLSAVSTLACAPILIFGWISQKQLVRGLSFGAVK